jgi:hypothetical protein
MRLLIEIAVSLIFGVAAIITVYLFETVILFSNKTRRDEFLNPGRDFVSNPAPGTGAAVAERTD